MKINIGSSSCHLDGWLNLEYDESYWKKHSFSGERISSKATRDMPDVFGDGADLSQFSDNTFDEIRASHVLEHISQNRTVQTLKEWNRVLVPGGVARVIVPDTFFCIDKLLNKDDNKEWWDGQINDKALYIESELKKPFEIEDEAFMHLLFLNGHHLCGFTPDLLKLYMEKAGFKDIERCDKEEEDIPDCSSYDYSLRMKGTK